MKKELAQMNQDLEDNGEILNRNRVASGELMNKFNGAISQLKVVFKIYSKRGDLIVSEDEKEVIDFQMAKIQKGLRKLLNRD